MKICLAVIGVFVSLLCGSPVASAATPPTLSVVGDDTVTIKAKDGQDTATAHIVVLNAGQQDAPLTIELQAASTIGLSISAVIPKTLAAGQATRALITVAGLKDLKKEKVDAQLVLQDPGGTPIAQPLSITPAPHPAQDWPTWIFIGALIVLAVLFVFGGLVGLFNGTILKQAAGPKWSFSSWATTATAVGGVFGTVLAAATLPDVPSQIDKDTLVRLNLLYGALVVVGPFVFQALRNPRADATDQEAGFVGWNLTLLLSCSITAAAVFGELAALGLLGWELTGGGTWGSTILVGVIVLGVLAALYFGTTVWGLVRTDWKLKALTAKAAAAQRTLSLTVGSGEGANQRERHYWVQLDDVPRPTVPAAMATTVAAATAAAAQESAGGEAPATTITVPVDVPVVAAPWSLP
ncbi:MAG: hypothetical protein ABW167_00790 [Baekduia sp.]